MPEEKVILVDKNDHEIGVETKLIAHKQGLKHRAFSVFIFHEKSNDPTLLLQQRQEDKYHCGGLWTNTCCSHPRSGENVITAGERRLAEEMGMHVKLTKAGEFQYRAAFDNGLIENEYDHVLIGFSSESTIHFNKDEVANIRWTNITTLLNELESQPEKFTPWLKEALLIALNKIEEKGFNFVYPS